MVQDRHEKEEVAMFETMMIPIMAFSTLGVASWMAGAYVICLIVGGGLLFISTVFGGDADTDLDADVDFDADFDVDADSIGMDHDVEVSSTHVEHGALSLSSWFSVRFIIYFMAVFGVVGTVLTFLSQVHPPIVAVISVIAGMIIGQSVHQVLRYLNRTGKVISVTAEDYKFAPARVTVSILPPNKGEISVAVRGRTRYSPALAKRQDDQFEPGDQVVIVGFKNGTAKVISQKEYEFVKDSKTA